MRPWASFKNNSNEQPFYVDLTKYITDQLNGGYVSSFYPSLLMHDV